MAAKKTTRQTRRGLTSGQPGWLHARKPQIVRRKGTFQPTNPDRGGDRVQEISLDVVRRARLRRSRRRLRRRRQRWWRLLRRWGDRQHLGREGRRPSVDAERQG